ncbi:MAG: FUN14 domain-containing protein [Candidatus Riflebacteria bacterium]|nr:FUN14 domain-containing protein [Candidatus Riflebacteria bacterium]
MQRYFLFTAILFFIVVAVGAQSVASVSAEAPGQGIPLPEDIKFILMTLGGGGLAGWAVGFTLKKFAKLAALILGIGFISIQALAFHKFIVIDWERIKTAVPDKTIETSASSMMSVITYNLPFAGSFLVGFWMGFRKG